MNLMRVPQRRIPISTWTIPPRKTMTAVRVKMAERGSDCSKMAGCFMRLAMNSVITTVMGPVGPVIWEGVPPNRAAKMPVNMAPYMPAAAPWARASGVPMETNAETPNARARGRAITAADMPPEMSPFMLLNVDTLCLPGRECRLVDYFP